MVKLHHNGSDGIRIAIDSPPRHDTLIGFPSPPPWMAGGICASTDPELFFPEKGGTTEPAKKICAGCPVRRTCLDYALEHGERHGIWGGVSERRRRGLERDRAASA